MAKAKSDFLYSCSAINGGDTTILNIKQEQTKFMVEMAIEPGEEKGWK